MQGVYDSSRYHHQIVNNSGRLSQPAVYATTILPQSYIFSVKKTVVVEEYYFSKAKRGSVTVRPTTRTCLALALFPMLFSYVNQAKVVLQRGE